MRYRLEKIAIPGAALRYQNFDSPPDDVSHKGLQWVADPVPSIQEPSLAEAKEQQKLAINGARLVANRSTFTHAGKQIACDELSRSDIDGVAQAIMFTGELPANFPGVWKATDNTYVLIATPADFKALHASMVAAGAANFLKSEQKKAAINAATTLAEVYAIVW